MLNSAECSMKRVYWIDFAKALAIIGVVVVHVSQVLRLPSWAHLAASFGAMGVQLFFLLSAYCLCMTWNERPLTWRWWWRKYCRLAPWYLVGILLYWLYHELVCDNLVVNYTAVNIVANVLLINGFVPSAQNSIVPGGWSISCIALFVFIWPLLCNLRTMTLIVIGITGLVVNSIGYLFLEWSRFYAYCSPFSQFIVFVLGVTLFRWKDRIRPLNAVSIMVVFFLASVVAVFLGKEYNILYRHVLMAISFCGFSIILMRHKIYGGGLLWIGRHSYEIFILHFLVIWCIKRLVK